MSTEGLYPVMVDQYGGLCTLIDRSDLPIGMSPACQNVEFFPGGVRSRSGFYNFVDMTTVAEQLFSYVSTDNSRYLISEGGGALRAILPGGTVGALSFWGSSSPITGLGAGLYMRGVTLYGRAFLAFSDGKTGTVGPFQYDGTKVSAVGQYGPSASFLITPNFGAGTMSAGYHAFALSYETATGYITGLPAVSGETFASGDSASMSNIPIGPGSVKKRIFFATAAGGQTFYTLPRFVLADNTTTTMDLDFTDAELLAGTALEDFIENVPVSPMLGVEKYGNRLVYWGGNSSLQPFLDTLATTNNPTRVGLVSLDFDGDAAGLPSEWIASGSGGSIVTTTDTPLLVYRITGDGVTATMGRIHQERYNYGASYTFYVLPGRRYGIRVRIRRSDTAIAGTLEIIAKYAATGGVGAGTTFASFTKTVASMSTSWETVTDETGTVDTGASGQFVNIDVKVTGTLTNGGIVDIDWIQVYDLAEKNAGSFLYVTPPNDPEAIRPATDIVPVSEDDGQSIRDVFQLRGNLYACKERSMYVTTDNSGGLPYEWTVDQVSNEVGTPSVHGVAVGDGWAIIASRNGVYHFSGGVPEKISQEIQPTWDSIAWEYAHTMWTAIDTSLQRVFIAAPFTGETFPTSMLVLDYVEGFRDPISSGGGGRKWTLWSSALMPYLAHGAMAERDDLTSNFVIAKSNRMLMLYWPAGVCDGEDDFTAIDSYYETAPIGTEIGRSLFDRVVLRIRGVGSLATQSRTPGGTLATLAAKQLSASPDDDVEIRMHSQQTQVGYRIGTNEETSYWSLRRLGVFIRTSEYTVLRKT